jgi:transposase InsO family protein
MEGTRHAKGLRLGVVLVAGSLAVSASASAVAARRAVFNYVEGWYKTRRLDSSLSYLSPAQWEAAHRTAVAQAA